jgi:putative membrane protein
MRTDRLGVILLAAGLLGCGGSDQTADQASADSAAAAVPATPQVTDPEIAHIAVTANRLDTEAGELAKTKTKNADVKQFAETMIRDHTNVNNEAGALAQRLNVTPADNATSQTLVQDAERAKTDLTGKTGAEFDRSYIANEVTYHEAVLNALDQTLIPNAQNAELKAFLEKVRPAIQAHLDMAKTLQGKLAGGS